MLTRFDFVSTRRMSQGAVIASIQCRFLFFLEWRKENLSLVLKSTTACPKFTKISFYSTTFNLPRSIHQHLGSLSLVSNYKPEEFAKALKLIEKSVGVK